MSAEFHDDDRDQEKESYSFLKETIKKPPLDRRVVLIKILKTAGLGLVFGLAACIGFSAVKPWADSCFGAEQKRVTIPKDEKEEDEKKEEKEEQTETKQALTIQNYQELYQELGRVASSVQKGLVTLEGTVEGMEEQSDSEVMENQEQISGVIVADNGVEFLILAQNRVFEKGKQVKASFYDGNSIEVSLKKQDSNRGLAVYAAQKTELPANTRTQLTKVVLGNSNIISAGDPVIAVGMPFGENGTVGYGVISQTSNTRIFADNEYQVFNTDIVGTAKSGGVLLDMKGEIIGLIFSQEEKENTVLSAYAISGMKEEIERLSNGRGLAYAGVEGTGVSDGIANGQEIPKGVYVTAAVPDSPAMKAGIQSGDILTEIEDVKIYTMKAYKEELLKHNPGNKIIIKGKRRGTDGYVDIQFDVTLTSAE